MIYLFSNIFYNVANQEGLPETAILQEIESKRWSAQRGLYEHMLVDKAKIDDHPSWREVRAWHSAQRVSALSRPIKAKSKAVATYVSLDILKCMRRVGCDSIVMQGAGADEAKMADQGYRGIVNFVDYTTKRAFPFAVRKVGDSEECGAKFVEMIRQVRTDFYGNPDATDWPVDKMLVYVDGGNEFGTVFKGAVRDELAGVDVTFQAAQSNNPNSVNSTTENSNKQVRNVLRRIAQANRLTTQNDGKKSKPWQSYWYGRQGVIFKQMVQLVNQRIDNSLGRLQPILVWNAYVEMWKRRGDTASAEYKSAQKVVQDAQDALMKDADMRRGPSRLKKANWFKKGQIVRRENTFYSKDGIRSNMTKQGNRFSLSTYKVYSVQAFKDAPPIYELRLHTGTKPSDFKTKPNGVGTTKYPHDQLILVIGDEDAPQDLMDNGPPPDGADFAIGDTIAVEWVRVKESDDSEEMTINYANLSQLVQTGQLKEILPNSSQWYEGEVVDKYYGPYAGLKVMFDDQDLDDDDPIRISFRNNNRHYVKPDSYDRV